MDSISGIETAKTLALEPVQKKNWEDAISEHTVAHLKLGSANAVSQQISSTLQQLMTVAVIFIGEKLAKSIQTRDAKNEELVKLRRQRENIEILAPADGVIISLENLYVGGVVKEGATVMTLVPSNVPLNVEIDIDPRDISNIFPGADA